MFWPMGRLQIRSKTEISAWRELCIHYDTAFLPTQLSEVTFGASPSIDNCGVNFIVAVLLKNVEDRIAFFEGMNSGLIGICTEVRGGSLNLEKDFYLYRPMSWPRKRS
jgi:hypothetical protein